MTDRLNHDRMMEAIKSDMEMYLLVRRSLTPDSRRVVDLCARDVVIYLPNNPPTRMEVKNGVQMYFEHLGCPTLPSGEEVKQFHQEMAQA
jgi:hypothetical protein